MRDSPFGSAISDNDNSSHMPSTSRRASCPHMTNDKFKQLCEQVLIPRLGDLMHQQLTDMHETLDVFANELKRIGDRLERLIALMGERDSRP